MQIIDFCDNAVLTRPGQWLTSKPRKNCRRSDRAWKIFITSSSFSQNLPFVASSSLGTEPAHGSNKHENTLGLSLCLDPWIRGLMPPRPLTLQTAPTSASDSTLWPYRSYSIWLQSVTYWGKPPRKNSRLQSNYWQVVKFTCSTTLRQKKSVHSGSHTLNTIMCITHVIWGKLVQPLS